MSTATKLLQHLTNAQKVLLTPSGTAALELAIKLLDCPKGSEVIIPSYNFPSAGNAILNAGLKPVFAEIETDSLGICPSALESLITEHTSCIIPVHYAGRSCQITELQEIASSNNLPLIEDSAHTINAWHEDRHLGTFGDMGIISFHYSKNISCGQGGALLINKDQYNEYAEIIADKGTNRKQFFQKEIDFYSWVALGHNYRMSELLEEPLTEQLQDIDNITKQRVALWDNYYQLLTPLQEQGFIKLPSNKPDTRHNAHIFYFLLQDSKLKDPLLEHLRSKDILATFHYYPLHLSAMGKKLGYNSGDLPVTEQIFDSLLRLPLIGGVDFAQQELISKEIFRFFEI